MRQIAQTKESLKIARSALEAETHEVVQVSNRLNDNLAKAGKIIWRQLLFVWVVVIVLGISYFLVLNNAPIATNQAKEADLSRRHLNVLPETARQLQPSRSHSESLSTFPAIPEKDQLLNVLNQIREAQLTKDINLFLKAYSPSFPKLAQRRELILSIWERYDYIDSQFHLGDITPINSSLISGEVKWHIKARDRKTDEIKTFSKSYHVYFVKESEKWLIQKLGQDEGKENLE